MSDSPPSFRTFVVANPEASNGGVRNEWQLIERLLRANLHEFDYAFTEGPGHATLLTREALRAGWEMVVAVGGDGTLNEVVNGFFEDPEPEDHFERQADGFLGDLDGAPEPVDGDAVLGHLPLGTGGDFRRTIGFMGGLAETVEHLRGRHTRSVDLGQMGYVDHRGRLASRYFLNIACAGISGLVDHYVNSSWKGLGGTSFVWGTFRAFLRWDNAEMEIRLDETTEIRDRILNLVAANGEYFGGGMWIAPGAELDDGAFQVVVMGDLSKPRMIKVLPQLYSGKHLGCRKISRHRARRVSARAVDADQEVLLDADGEQPGRLPALWKLHPSAIELKV